MEIKKDKDVRAAMDAFLAGFTGNDAAASRAIADVISQGRGIREAAGEHGIPVSTLSDRVRAARLGFARYLTDRGLGPAGERAAMKPVAMKPPARPCRACVG